MAMLRLQDNLNKAVDPDWLKSDHDWGRAIHAESIELMDLVGWKWWKAHTPDPAQVELELIDIWHFILALLVNDCDGNIQKAGLMLIQAWDEALPPPTDSKNLSADLAEAIGLAAREDTHRCVLIFRIALGHFKVSDETLYKTYVAKNVLNLFRQEHGYKAGTYQRVWQGRDDNVVLADIMAREPSFGPSELHSALSAEYRPLA